MALKLRLVYGTLSHSSIVLRESVKWLHARNSLYPILRTGVCLCNILNGWAGGHTNPRRHVAFVTKFCMVAPHICGSSVWNVLQVSLWPHEMRWHPNTLKICAPLQRKLNSSQRKGSSKLNNSNYSLHTTFLSYQFHC